MGTAFPLSPSEKPDTQARFCLLRKPDWGIGITCPTHLLCTFCRDFRLRGAECCCLWHGQGNAQQTQLGSNEGTENIGLRTLFSFLECLTRKLRLMLA